MQPQMAQMNCRMGGWEGMQPQMAQMKCRMVGMVECG